MSLLSLSLTAALLAADPPPAVEETFINRSQGVALQAAVGYGPSGDHLAGNLGFAATGLRFEKRWLTAWDALVYGAFGYLANARPYLQWAGARTHLAGDFGYRFGDGAWAPFGGGALMVQASAMAHPGLDISALDTVNNPDGWGGINAAAHVRVEGGMSRLSGDRSELLVGFVQEGWRNKGLNRPAMTFTGIGLSARYDLMKRLTAIVEVSLGWSPVSHDSVLQFSNQTTREDLLASVQYKFHSGWWLSGSFGIGRDMDSTRYWNGLTYNTAHSQDLEIGIAFGAPLGRQN
jgi:hypothetical protein